MEEQEAKQAVLQFTEALLNAGVSTVSVSYSGCGDEGRTEDPQLQDEAGDPLVATSLPSHIDVSALGDLLATFVPEGYEENEGGWGTVTFNVPNGKIRIENNWWETVSHAVDPREI